MVSRFLMSDEDTPAYERSFLNQLNLALVDENEYHNESSNSVKFEGPEIICSDHHNEVRKDGGLHKMKAF